MNYNGIFNQWWLQSDYFCLQTHQLSGCGGFEYPLAPHYVLNIALNQKTRVWSEAELFFLWFFGMMAQLPIDNISFLYSKVFIDIACWVQLHTVV